MDPGKRPQFTASHGGAVCAFFRVLFSAACQNENGAVRFPNARAIALWLMASAVLAAAPDGEEFGRKLSAGEELHRRGEYAEAERQLLALLAETDAAEAADLRKPAVLNNLGSVYHSMNRYPQAEHCYRRAIAIAKAAGAAGSEFHFRSTVNLACLYLDMGQRQKAVRLGLDTLAKNRPPARRNAADFARLLSTLAGLEFDQRRLAAAERLAVEALKIWEVLTPNGIELIEALNNLGVVYGEMSRNTQAREAYGRALNIAAATLPADDPAQVTLLANAGTFYAGVDGLAAAERFYDRALSIAQKKLGDEHPMMAKILSSYAVLLERAGRKAEARQYQRRARAITDTFRKTDPRSYTVDVRELKGRVRPGAAPVRQD